MPFSLQNLCPVLLLVNSDGLYGTGLALWIAFSNICVIYFVFLFIWVWGVCLLVYCVSVSFGYPFLLLFMILTIVLIVVLFCCFVVFLMEGICSGPPVLNSNPAPFWYGALFSCIMNCACKQNFHWISFTDLFTIGKWLAKHPLGNWLPWVWRHSCPPIYATGTILRTRLHRCFVTSFSSSRNGHHTLLPGPL